jgi:two-component system, LytTR family, response regulator
MAQRLTALLIDDEKRATALLKKLLEETKAFSAIYSSQTASTALQLTRKHLPDMIFLDINMPDKDGFWFLGALRDEGLTPEVVFVTAFDQFTMKALKNHAFDYLLKPVDRHELWECIRFYRSRRSSGEVSVRLERFLQEYDANRKIRFNTRTGFFQIDPTMVLYCRADGNYTHIHTGEREHLCTVNLSGVQVLLPRQRFVRIGRSYIINTQYVCSVDRKASEIMFEKDGQYISIHLPAGQIRELDKLM